VKVQAISPKQSVEGLNKVVLDRLTWVDMLQLDSEFFRKENIALLVNSGPLSQAMVLGLHPS